MPDTACVVVLITAPSRAVAESMAHTLVGERLAACVNIVPAIRSVYRWEGKVQSADETLMIVKSTRERFARLETRVQEIHPYDVPEIVAIIPDAISDSYRRFLEENT